MKKIIRSYTLLLLIAFVTSCGKNDDKDPGPGPGPGPDPGTKKIERTGTAELSSARKELKAAAAGNKILFAGGIFSLSYPAAADIYDISTHTWTTANLSIPRVDHAMAAAGNKIFIGGGSAFYSGINATASVEIYDVSTGQWAYQTLSSARRFLAAAGLQNKVFFAGGGAVDGSGTCCVVSNAVDIYDVTTGSRSQAVLSVARDNLAAAAIGNKVLFAGGMGHSNQTGGFFSSRVDIYDISTGAWSTAELSEARSELCAAAAGNKILFAGGRKSNLASGQSTVVDIYDVSTGQWSAATLSDKREGTSIAVIGNKILIAGGYSTDYLSSVDVYDVTTGQWEKLELSVARMDGAAAGISNELLVAGGFDKNGFSKTVDIFQLK